jgi:periplasmic protein CpxP/Spy
MRISARFGLTAPVLAGALVMGGLALPRLGMAQTTSSPATSPAKTSVPTHAAAASAAPGMQAAVEQRIKDLHTKLHITSAEESQWDQFAQLMRDNAKSTDALYQAREQTAATMTAVENLQSYSDIAQKHAEDIQKLVPAFQTMYDSFSTQQKKQADDVFRNYAEQAQQTRAAKK